MAIRKQLAEFMRQKPKQQRALDTVDTILEAAAQVVAQEGADGVSTNAVAERAGFGVGTLYQYFRNKEALLLGLMQREADKVRGEVAELTKRGDQLTVDQGIRELMRIVIRAFGSRPHVRRAMILYLAGRIDLRKFQALTEDIAGIVRDAIRWRNDLPMPSQLRFRLLTRAVIGTIRATVIAEPDRVLTQEFEDEIVTLVSAYLAAPEVSPGAPIGRG
jgi:AcrR family transcriptional regulator